MAASTSPFGLPAVRGSDTPPASSESVQNNEPSRPSYSKDEKWLGPPSGSTHGSKTISTFSVSSPYTVINSGSVGFYGSIEESCSSEGGTQEDLEVDDMDSPSCTEFLMSCPRKLRGGQRHRRCPHTFSICLIFFMFFLLGIVERGGFAVLFYILNFHSPFKSGEALTIYFAIKFLIYTMYPVTGFLADMYFGRYKVIRVGLCVAWVGSAFITLSIAITKAESLCDPHEHCHSVIATLVIIGYLIMGAGLTGIRVNLIPFGADQLPDVSGGELSSYFYWYYFCITLGNLIGEGVFFFISKNSSLVYIFLTITITISIFLSTFIAFRHHWLIFPKSGNPLRLVLDVVKSSLERAKKPLQPSAFDVGMPKPTLLDRARIKYGGSFTLEQVETVKTFFRLLVIVMSSIGYYAVFSQLQSATSMQSYRMMGITSSNCSTRQLDHLRTVASGVSYRCWSWPDPYRLFFATNLIPLILIIPFYDRIVYSCLSGWKWFSMLTRMAFGNLFAVLTAVSAIVIEGFRMKELQETFKSNETVVEINAISYHKEMTDYQVSSSLHLYYLVIPFFFFVFAELLSNITAVEFIYAQAPGNMKGIFIGLLFGAEGIAMGLSSIATAIITEAVPHFHPLAFFSNTRYFYKEALNSTSTCRQEKMSSLHFCSDTIIFPYSVLTLIATVSAVVFIVAAAKYKYRRRNSDPYMPIWLLPEDKMSKLQYLVRKCCC